MNFAMEITDPYEQYLLAVFESCDDFHSDGLSAAGLQQLCEKLQLDDSYGKLRECLLGEFKSKRVPFHEFKDGLLKLLGSMENEQKVNEDILPVEELPSKPGVGKKFYNKCLKGDVNPIEQSCRNTLFERQQSQIYSCSTEDSSSEETVPKKRRTRNKKKKEKKLSKNELIMDIQNMSGGTANEVDHLISAWSNISSGGTDSLKRDELVKVFQCVGLERGSEEAARCVFDKLGIDEKGKITLQELLEFIRSGESWNKEYRNQHMEVEPAQKNISVDFKEPSMFGHITGSALVEQWEYAGVPGAAQLLQNLGFGPTQQIDLSSLVSMLSEEIKGLNDETKSARRSMDPYLALLRANSVLQTLYIRSLKTLVEHVNAEKEKFRNDVAEANQRALLLAQEVDDHHSKLEHSAQQQVKLLEQRHSEKIREMTNQAKCEQDGLLAQNAALERKLTQLECEEVKNKAVIAQLEMENKLLEQENRSFVDQLSAVQSTKDKLEEDLESFASLQQKINELEMTAKENDVCSLIERIKVLEKENTHLRDRNDELSVEVEELSNKLWNASVKNERRSSKSLASMAETSSREEISSAGGTKRRGDSSFEPVEFNEDSSAEEGGSPRLGKVRKFSHANDFAEAASSLQELAIGGGDKNEKRILPEGNDCHQKEPYPAKGENSHRFERVNYTEKLMAFSEELAQVEAEAAAKFVRSVFSEKIDATAFEKIEKKLELLGEDVKGELMAMIRDVLKKKDDIHGDAEKKLMVRCSELEASLELLREEYEKTEDYWSEKLEEERNYFEEEQKMSDKKYSELLEKILEYEEMLQSESGQRQRLETIEERDNFEKEVAEMERECADLRFQLSETIKAKDLEIENLRKRANDWKVFGDCVDSGIQVADFMDSELSIIDDERQASRIKSRNVFQGRDEEEEFKCNQCALLKNFQEIKLRYQKEIRAMKGEWEKLYEDIVSDNKRPVGVNLGSGHGDGHGDGGSGGDRSLRSQLERKCQSLMTTLRQQQKQTEDILKNTWRQHKIEVNDLKSVLKMTEEKLKRQTRVIQEQLNKLSKTDILVKDLFVENAYLLSSVQKLEQECRSRSGNPMADR